MKKRLVNRYVLFLITLVFIFSLTVKYSYKVNANQDKPNVKITVTTNKSNMLVNEELEVKYRVEPEPLNIEDVNKKMDKEIILVVDTSGSMVMPVEYGSSRIEALKEAAKNFIYKFKDEDKVKIGIVSYATKAEQNIELISSKEQATLLNVIDNLKAEGTTNIGDGIRVATKMFSKESSISKYVVLMSDGMPTALTYTGEGGYWDEEYYYDEYGNPYGREYIKTEKLVRDYNIYSWDKLVQENDRWSYFGINDTADPKYGAYGDYDPKGYSLKYSNLMAAELKKSNITNYVIGFSGSSDSSKLINIAQSSGGTYYDAMDAMAINEVYSNIGDQIKADYAVEGVKLKFNLPEGMECSINNTEISKLDNGYIKSIPNIMYKLNKDKNQYIADSFDIVVRLKANKSGNYILGDAWELNYMGVDNNNVIKAIPQVNISVNKYSMDFDISRRLLPEVSNGQFNINKEFEIEYSITPRAIPVEIPQKPKEIMLVVDTSGSMQWAIDKDEYGYTSRMELTKEALKNFVDKFKDSKDVKIGITSYIDEANIHNFGTDSNPKYFTEASNVTELYKTIDDLVAGGATNIGEGMRKALWSLSLDKDYSKYMVLMSDGSPSTYTYIHSADNFYTEISNDNSQDQIGYINDWDKGLKYSNLMASMVKENKDLNIKSFAIGFSKGADSYKLQEIANSAGGAYLDATANDEQAINNVYMGIADKIKADFTLENVRLNEILPEGFTVVDGEKNNFIKDLKINYVYNNEKGQYEAEPIKFKIKVVPNKVGSYNLNEDATLSYTDLEGIPHSKRFNSLNIAIVDEYVIKQGLFQKDDSYKGNYPGENNIKYFPSDNINIVNDNLTRLGAFIRTNGQQTNISIKLNENKNPAIKNLYDIKVNVFKVNDNGEIIKTNISSTISEQTNNSANISVLLPREDINDYSYYIINYDFKANSEGKKNINMINKCVIEGTDKSNNLNIIVAELPDLF